MKKRFSIVVVLALCLALTLSGCYTTPSTQPSDSEVALPETNSVATEVEEQTMCRDIFYADNLPAALPSISVFPAENGIYTTNLRYYDIEQRAYVSLCSVPGCSHSDGSCPSRIKQVAQLLVCNAKAYVFCDNERGLSLLRYDPQSGEKKEIFSWEKKETGSIVSLNNSFYSTGRIYFAVTEDTAEERRNASYYYDISSKEVVMLFDNDELSYAYVEGAYGDRIVVTYVAYTQEPLTRDEYLRENPGTSEDAYDIYLEEFNRTYISSERRLYDLKTMEYSDFTPMLQAESSDLPNLLLSSNGAFYGQYILYSCGDKICRYDMAEDRVEVLAQEPNAVNAMLLDGRLLCILQQGEGLVFRIYDPDTGEHWEMENEGNKDYMVFGIHSQTKDVFIGLYQGRSMMICKEDFFAENYENAFSYGGS